MAKVKKSDTKKFAGKIYKTYSAEYTKRDAVSTAAKLRKEGHLARIMKSDVGYFVYVKWKWD